MKKEASSKELKMPFLPVEGFTEDILSQTFNKPEIKILNEWFDLFSNVLYKSCDKKNQKIFRSWEKDLRRYYLCNMWREIQFHPFTKAVNEETKITENLLNNKDIKFKFMSEGFLKFFYFAFYSIILLTNSTEATSALMKILEKNLKQFGKLDISDPNEQKLFKAVWKINDSNNKKNIKFSPYATFKKINDKKNYVDSELIYSDKFTETSELYNRYKQFRKRQQKK